MPLDPTDQPLSPTEPASAFDHFCIVDDGCHDLSRYCDRLPAKDPPLRAVEDLSGVRVQRTRGRDLRETWWIRTEVGEVEPVSEDGEPVRFTTWREALEYDPDDRPF